MEATLMKSARSAVAACISDAATCFPQANTFDRFHIMTALKKAQV